MLSTKHSIRDIMYLTAYEEVNLFFNNKPSNELIDTDDLPDLISRPALTIKPELTKLRKEGKIDYIRVSKKTFWFKR